MQYNTRMNNVTHKRQDMSNMIRNLVDTEGENRACRSFLMVYGTPGLTVIAMKKHMTLSGFELWPEWVDEAREGEHLTKAGAQLWIRHLFSLEKMPSFQRSERTEEW